MLDYTLLLASEHWYAPCLQCIMFPWVMGRAGDQYFKMTMPTHFLYFNSHR